MHPGGREFMERLAGMRPKVDEALCTGCGSCVEECPADALTMLEAYPEVDPEKCIACFCCQEKCPEKAIQLR
jgi:NAD-dependent dihydropyrimidine dehydrogenase PreA subunit